MSLVSSFFICLSSLSFFFFNDTPPTEIYTLSLHDALPILSRPQQEERVQAALAEARHELFGGAQAAVYRRRARGDRKSTRLNSSHVEISYAVFCLKKKKKKKKTKIKKKTTQKVYSKYSKR